MAFVMAFALAALLLAVERLSYFLIWNWPQTFVRLCRSWLGEDADPVAVTQHCFYAFKVLQLGVFFGWCVFFSESGWPWPTAGPLAFAAGAALIVVGQMLNASVFWRLGRDGVFYGNKLGRPIGWQSGFPFSLLPHPQYVGALLSVWGFFLVMRHPEPDWIALPLLSTGYYALGAWLEH